MPEKVKLRDRKLKAAEEQAKILRNEIVQVKKENKKRRTIIEEQQVSWKIYWSLEHVLNKTRFESLLFYSFSIMEIFVRKQKVYDETWIF